jgi:hypothetical protein
MNYVPTQFETVIEHHYCMTHEKVTYLIAALNEPVAHILHGLPQRKVKDVLAKLHGGPSTRAWTRSC